MRGDEPAQEAQSKKEAEMAVVSRVFPTCVGMNRTWWRPLLRPFRIPHMRGDEPVIYSTSWGEYQYSPHAWG